MATVPVRALLLLMAAAGGVLAAVPLASNLLALPIPALTRDVAAVADVHPLTGMLSNLGILVWWTSASVWLLAAALQWRRKNGAFWFAVYSGLLSAYLALDDLFLLHEQLLPRYLGVAEVLVYSVIALAVLLYLMTFRSLLRPRRDTWLLLASLGFLAASLAVDLAPKEWLASSAGVAYLLEDGLKWFGACFWTGFCLARCSADLAPSLSASSLAAGTERIQAPTDELAFDRRFIAASSFDGSSGSYPGARLSDASVREDTEQVARTSSGRLPEQLDSRGSASA
jgi:hypothetical protein